MYCCLLHVGANEAREMTTIQHDSVDGNSNLLPIESMNTANPETDRDNPLTHQCRLLTLTGSRQWRPGRPCSSSALWGALEIPW
eukprot:scaffold105374_cov17-Prasinocladus_malaysianus.AAC.1